MIIIGAGLAGLIAAKGMPNSVIQEASPSAVENHQALLRFRTDEVSKLTGIPFKKVMVDKGIWHGGKFREPNIMLCNMYASKVIGSIQRRSIWDIKSEKRFIAPKTFYQQLLEGAKVEFGAPFDFGKRTPSSYPVVSTVPLPVMVKACGFGIEGQNFGFDRSSIRVRRYKLSNCDVYQTIYFPTPEHTMYRASITGDTLICEFAGEIKGDWQNDLLVSFDIKGRTEFLIEAEQPYGKISKINEEVRQSLVTKLTADHNIFSLGRFATWRNLLLDDLPYDIEVIKRLQKATTYQRTLFNLRD